VKKMSHRIGLVSLLLSGIGLSGAVYGQSVFTVHKTGEFHHHLSADPGAYDLAADVMRSNSDPDSLKDFLNIDSAGSFDGKWKPGNATTFVNAPRYPTFNAQTGSVDFTLAKIDSIYKAGTPILQQDAPGTGSKHVWIGKLRGGSEYVIVKFLTIIGSSSDIAGVTTFEYWKMPSNDGSPTGLKSIAGADKKSNRPKASMGRFDIGLDGKNAIGVKTLNMLGQAVPESKASHQKYVVPLGN
jgi:hypothetical protein